MMIKKKSTSHYIDNKLFYTEMVKFWNSCQEAKKNGEPRPEIPEYVGKCIMLIAQRLSTRPNFIGYSYREEMVGDGIENCLMYFDNFDPNKSKNPFAYFTQIIYYAFLRRIGKEKKQLYVKYKATEQMGILDEFEMMEFEDGTSRQFELYDNIAEFIETYESAKANKKTVNKPKGIEKFIGE